MKSFAKGRNARRGWAGVETHGGSEHAVVFDETADPFIQELGVMRP